MNRSVLVAAVVLILDLSGHARIARANSAPVISNVTSVQRNDGSKIVEIRYNLADADGDACTVTVQVSNNAGSTWTVPITSVSGALGPGITPGVNKLILWNCATDLPGAFGSQYKVRVIADDGYNPTPPGMVLIPAGSFNMGDAFNDGFPPERPVHSVYVSAYFMDRYENTNQQYKDALNWALAQGNLITVTGGVVYKYNSGTSFPYCDTTSGPTPLGQITWNGNTFGVTAGKENHPMIKVSWYGAAAYSNWRSVVQGRTPTYDTATWACNFAANGYRLPTEAEWEKAARGGAAGHRFPWSDTDTIQHARANYYSWPTGPGGTPYSYDTSPTQGYHPTFYESLGGCFSSPFGYFAPNGYGLYDMAGNVNEWCNDWYGSNYYSSSPGTDPHGPTSGSGNVVRGGAWCCYYANGCRVSHRDADFVAGRHDYTGFRLALDGP